MESIGKQIIKRIDAHKSGWCFSVNDFADLGSAGGIRIALVRLTEAGRIRRVARGIYDAPRRHPSLGVLSPLSDQVAQAMARAKGTQLLPSGAQAANELGLSDQVPAKKVLVSSRAAASRKVGRHAIQFKHTSRSYMMMKNRVSVSVVSALEFIGKEHVDTDQIERLRKVLTDAQKSALLKEKRLAPQWTWKYLDAICGRGKR